MKEGLKRVKENKSTVGIILIEFVLVATFIASLVQIAQINITDRVVTFNLDPTLLLFAGLSVVLFIGIYAILWKKQSPAYEVQVLAGKALKEETKKRLKRAKEDPRVAALILIEGMFAFFIAYALAAYIDPEITFINWSRFNIEAPISWALNVIIFGIVLGVFLKMYSYTKDFREQK
jgi:hypothetical protein